MSSSTEICNLALNHVNGKEIQNLDTDSSNEASVCRRFYEQARNEMFEDFPWPFAEIREQLSLVSETPTDDWAYSYQYPSNCARLGYIPSGVRNDTKDSAIPYKVVYGDSGEYIYTDQENAEIVYTRRVTDESRFPAKFVIALSYKLAGYIAGGVSGGDPFKLGEKADKKYEMMMAQLQSNVLNEQRREPAPESEFISARD